MGGGRGGTHDLATVKVGHVMCMCVCVEGSYKQVWCLRNINISCIVPRAHACMGPRAHACMVPRAHACMVPRAHACMVPRAHACMVPRAHACMHGTPHTWCGSACKDTCLTHLPPLLALPVPAPGPLHVRGPATIRDQVCAPETDARVQGGRADAGELGGGGTSGVLSSSDPDAGEPGHTRGGLQQ